MASLLSLPQFVLAPSSPCPHDVALLLSLGSTGKQNHQSITLATKVNALARPKVDPPLADTIAHRFNITHVAEFHPRYHRKDFRKSHTVEPSQPLGNGASACRVDVLDDLNLSLR
jgi:hypothetical protein